MINAIKGILALIILSMIACVPLAVACAVIKVIFFL
nr:MAG TPA: hypothetical protein [Caudoviricetes sp.]